MPSSSAAFDRLPLATASAWRIASLSARCRALRRLSQSSSRRVGGQPEVVGSDVLALGHDHRAIDAVLELADVARPRIGLDRLERIRREAAQRAAVLAAAALHDGLRDHDRVARALAQRRDADRDLADPVVEILAERRCARSAPAGPGSWRRRCARRPGSARARRCARSRAPAGSAAASPAAAAACRRSRRGTACRRRPARTCPASARTAPVNAPFS